MSHTGVDVVDFLLFTIYPVIGIFAVEVFSRIIRIPKWSKLFSQAIVSIAFAVVYLTLPGNHKFPLTAVVLIALGFVLLYQGKRAKLNPEKVPY